jgi:hypothetical protein
MEKKPVHKTRLQKAEMKFYGVSKHGEKSKIKIRH